MADDRQYRSRDERFRDDDRYSGSRDQGSRDHGGRGFFERAGDEISSWFGDEEAERRREQDDRSGGYGRDDYGRSGERSDSYRCQSDRDRGGLFGSRDREDGRERGGFFGDSGRYARPPQFDREQSERNRAGRDERPQGYARGEQEDYRPFAGDYGRGSSERHERSEPRGVGRGSRMSSAAAGTIAGSSRSFDPHYQEWRQRQIDQLDQDYEEYRREHQSKFDNDFSGWRNQRQTKRQTLSQVREHMEVVGSDEQTVGIVDKVLGDKIILTRDSQGGVHRSLDCTAIDRVEGDRLILSRPADEARRALIEEPNFKERNAGDTRRPSAQDGHSQQQSDGPHILERSFSGTYPDEANR